MLVALTGILSDAVNEESVPVSDAVPGATPATICPLSDATAAVVVEKVVKPVATRVVPSERTASDVSTPRSYTPEHMI